MAPPADLAALYHDHLEYVLAAYGRAITEAGLAGLVIGSGPARSKSPFDDQDFPFRPTPAFAHLLPLVEPAAAVVLVPGARPRLLRTSQPSMWESPVTLDADHVWAAFEVVHSTLAEVPANLPGGALAFIGDDPGEATAFGVAEPSRVNPPELVAALDAVRRLKTPYERWCMADANRRAVRGHLRTQELL